MCRMPSLGQIKGEGPPQFLEKNQVGQLKSPDEYEPNDTSHLSI